jgi:hypothetical protein
LFCAIFVGGAPVSTDFFREPENADKSKKAGARAGLLQFRVEGDQ